MFRVSIEKVNNSGVVVNNRYLLTALYSAVRKVEADGISFMLGVIAMTMSRGDREYLAEDEAVLIGVLRRRLEAASDFEFPPGVRQVLQHAVDSFDRDAYAATPEGRQAVSEAILANELTYLGLSARALNALEIEGICTVGALIEKTVEQLLELNNVGKGTIEEIRTRLRAAGLNLRGERSL